MVANLDRALVTIQLQLQMRRFEQRTARMDLETRGV